MTDNQREFDKWLEQQDDGDMYSSAYRRAWQAALAHSQIDKKPFVHKLAELKNSKHISSDAHALILSMLFPITNRKDE